MCQKEAMDEQVIYRLNDDFAVTGQVAAADMLALADAGFRLVVTNRPDGEEEGQPTAEELGVAARDAGLAYVHIPVAGGIWPQDIAALAEILESAEGPVLAFCKSGGRSKRLYEAVGA